MEGIPNLWKLRKSTHEVVYLSKTISSDFEKEYIKLRSSEGWIYPDEMVLTLPDINKSAVHATEWKYRKISAERILKYLERKKAENILELGCGNGWFTNLISKRKKSITVGVDINETELIQAARLFSNEHTLFVYGDIFEPVWPTGCFNMIILNSSLQYFPNPQLLISKLLSLLTPNGEIHILDSPMYLNIKQAEMASTRSKLYFDSIGFTNQLKHYHHHPMNVLSNYKYSVMYDPANWHFIIEKYITYQWTPFPWICIKK